MCRWSSRTTLAKESPPQCPMYRFHDSSSHNFDPRRKYRNSTRKNGISKVEARFASSTLKSLWFPYLNDPWPRERRTEAASPNKIYFKLYRDLLLTQSSIQYMEYDSLCFTLHPTRFSAPFLLLFRLFFSMNCFSIFFSSFSLTSPQWTCSSAGGDGSGANGAALLG